ncbi:SEC-C metal-binding domain-containing protein [Calderihabitans maritimus]|nr:SEC-C metal-binding domain-containing protein [Calderihabitans maritimus]
MGRNEPCPCGSGKKYKKCCGKNSGNVIYLSDTMLHREVDSIRRQLVEFAEKNSDEFGTAFLECPISEYTDLDGIMQYEELGNTFLDWFVFDYKLKDGSTLFARFLEENREGLREALVEVLERWKEAPISAFEVVRVILGKGAVLRDIFSGEEKRLYYPYYPEEIPHGAIQICRLLPAGDWHEFLIGTYVAAPEDKEFILERVNEERQALADLGIEYESWGEFLKQHSEVLLEVICQLFTGTESETEIGDSTKQLVKQFVARKFLATPLPELGGRSPLEISSHRELEEKLEQFLADVARGRYDHEELGGITPSENLELIKLLLGLGKEKPRQVDDFTWQDDKYREEARLLVEKMKGEYLPLDIGRALEIWHQYSSEECPRFRKPGVWAAAVEYTLASMYKPGVTQQQVADKYGVSANSVSKNSYKIEEMIYWEFHLDEAGIAPVSGGSGRPLVERETARIQSLLEGQEFQSEEELQRFLDEINRGGLPEIPPEQMSPRRWAQEMIYDAWEIEDPQMRVRLAKKALKVYPHCADAYVILAEDAAATYGEAIKFYEKGVKAGEKSLGKEYFHSNKGYFWGLVETRPYMRAKMGLAQCLWEVGDLEGAIRHFTEMLELNPNDNQGVRYLLSTCLLEAGRYEELEELFRRYEEDIGVDWLYNLALYQFIKKGKNSPEAAAALKRAIKANRHVPAYLMGIKELPRELPDYFTLGSEDEAVAYAAYAKKVWQKTIGALEWLRSSI